MEFKCSSCNYTSYRKFHIKTHINSKNKCGENPQIIEIPIQIKCEHCNKSYNTQPSLKRHLKNCKVSLSVIETVTQDIKSPKFIFNEDCVNFMYILKEREFVNNSQSIFKIGFTARDMILRGNGYPKGSKLYCCLPVVGNPELNVINIFKEKFKHRIDIGNEYFEGEFQDIIVVFFNSSYKYLAYNLSA